MIEKTTDYTIFNKLSGNRTLKENYLRRLTNSIQNDNQLHLHPIIVDKNFDIIDGQHRLQAAKHLGVPVYYIKDENVKSTHVIRANATQETWKLADYVQFYAENEDCYDMPNRQDYVKIIDLAKGCDFGISAILCLLFGKSSRIIQELLKSGNFLMPNEQVYRECLDIYSELRDFCIERKIKPISMIKSPRFLTAFKLFVDHSDFDRKRLIDRLQECWYLLRPTTSVELYLDIIAEIYNYNMKKRIDVKDLI